MDINLAIKILGYMKDHEEKNLIIFGDKKDNAEALQFGIDALINAQGAKAGAKES